MTTKQSMHVFFDETNIFLPRNESIGDEQEVICDKTLGDSHGENDESRNHKAGLENHEPKYPLPKINFHEPKSNLKKSK